MIRRIAVLMTVLTLSFAASTLAAAAAESDCTLVGVGAEARDQQAQPEGVKDPTGQVCPLLVPS